MFLRIQNRSYPFTIIIIVIWMSEAVCKDKLEKIDSDVMEGSNTPVIVTFQTSSDLPNKNILHTLKRISSSSGTNSKVERDTAILKVLHLTLAVLNKDFAAAIQLLKQEGITYSILPISEQLYIIRPTKPLLHKLASLETVIRIRNEGTDESTHLQQTIPSVETEENSADTTWNLALINARCKDIKCFGNNVTVGIIGQGVMYDHIEIKDQWQGTPRGWADMTVDNATSAYPDDPLGYDTHFAGIVLGNSVGVAPNATWIACRMCLNAGSGCSEATFELCAIQMVCPRMWNDTTWSTANCSMGAQLVVVGRGVYFTRVKGPALYALYKVVQFLNYAGVITVFGAGDVGSGCSSAQYPGAYDIALSVGTVDQDCALWDSSACGPVVTDRPITEESLSKEGSTCPALNYNSWECSKASGNSSICRIVKPDLSAPGVLVRSSWIYNTSSYEFESLSGIAAAHTVGTLALAICANPNATWDYQTAYHVLTKTATTKCIDQKGDREESPYSLAGSNFLCNFVMSKICDGFPNNLYGWGLLQACDAVKAAKRLRNASININ